VASISEDLKNLGFKHIALDVDGYQKGSMNRNNG
jgi:PP-loop superfamily ATP-utilizing enzyme